MTQIQERIPDLLGSLVINENGAVISSSGELQNDEVTANKIMSMIQVCNRSDLSTDSNQQFKRMTVMFDGFMYVVTLSSRRVYIIKKAYNPHEPIMT